MIRWTGCAVLLLAAGFATAAEKELHVVALHQGHQVVRGQDHVRVAQVSVDRPGKEVILVVSAHEAVEWDVSATPKTTLTKVIAGGYKRQSVKAPKGVEIDEQSVECIRQRILQTALYAGYDADGTAFRSFVRALHNYTKLEIASFQGAYQFDSSKPFLVNAVQKDERLASDFPKVTPAAELPKFNCEVALPQLSPRYTKAVTFTQTGPERLSRYLTPEVLQITFDPKAKRYYAITEREFRTGKSKNWTETEIVPALEEELTGFRSITFDEKRERVVLCAEGGLYAHCPNENSWSVLGNAKSPQFAAIAWQKGTDTLFAVGIDRGAEGRGKPRPALYELNPTGAVVKTTTLAAPMFLGLFEEGDQDLGRLRSDRIRTQLVDLGGNLAVAVWRSEIQAIGVFRLRIETFLYVLDPKTGKSQLAWKEVLRDK
jgi:hypothetical protein